MYTLNVHFLYFYPLKSFWIIFHFIYKVYFVFLIKYYIICKISYIHIFITIQLIFSETDGFLMVSS